MDIEGLKTEKERKIAVDFITRLNGYGKLSTAQMDNISGININKTGTPAPKNKDTPGYTFFTRPDLNLNDDNLSVDRVMTPLLDSSTTSMARAIRAMLDYRSERDIYHQVKSDIFNSKQPFLPILTNNLISMSGWPDIALDSYTSKEGVYKESYSMVDGTSNLFNTFDLTANFRNIQGDPITLLFTVWVHYASKVYEGLLVPYPDLLIQNEIDYMTRIYRVVTDETNTYVQKIAACGAAFPLASPLGAAFNYNDEEEFNFDNDQISIPFRCIGANYMDPILIKEFNIYVSRMNPDMSDQARPGLMKKISPRIEYDGYGYIGRTLSKILSHQLFPRIEPTTMELEWWTTMDNYNLAISNLKERKVITNE